MIAMAPFEVVTGSHPADLHSGQRRFFQYLYRIRLINPDSIGKDVPIPDIQIHYRVNSKITANMAMTNRTATALDRSVAINAPIPPMYHRAYRNR